MWRWSIVIFGFIFLMLSSFLDNLRGPLLPQITAALQIPYGQSSALISVGNFSSMVVTLVLAFTTKIFSTRRVALFALLLGTVACASGALVTSYRMLVVFSASLGAAITLMGSMSNIFVMQGTPINQRARVMNALHSLYGIASLLAAIAVATQLRMNIHWHNLFLICALVLMVVAVFAASKMQNAADAQESLHIRLKLPQLFVCVPLVLYVAGEVGCSTWMVTYGVKSAALSEADASMLLSGFFGMIAVTRIAAVAFCLPGKEQIWIRVSLGAAFLSFLLGIFVSPYFLPLAGALGPFFPLYVNSISERFPANWQTIALIGFSLMQATMAIFHHGMGVAIDHFDGRTAYSIPCGILALALISQVGLRRSDRRQGQPIQAPLP